MGAPRLITLLGIELENDTFQGNFGDRTNDISGVKIRLESPTVFGQRSLLQESGLILYEKDALQKHRISGIFKVLTDRCFILIMKKCNIHNALWK